MNAWIKHNIEAFPETRILAPTLKEQNDVVVQKIENLGVPVPPYLQSLIELGDDAGNPRGTKDARFPSRSEASFSVMTRLSRLGVSSDKVAGICINPDYGISERFLERSAPSLQALKEALRAEISVSTGWPDVTLKGNPKASFHNAYVGLIKLGVECRYDEFNNRIIVASIPLQSYIGELSDKTVVIIRKVFLDEHHFDPYPHNIRDGIETLAHENRFHPIKSYFQTLSWDGKARIRSFFSTYMGAQDTELNQAIAFIMFVAAVRRVLSPGCKFDTMIVLEGVQGSGKSTLLRELASDAFFSDQDIISADSKTQMELLEGVWIYEVCELSGLKHTDINKVKSFLSRQEDRGRPAYGHYKEVNKRQSIFIGTTNNETYLKDNTGNRRYLPVKTGTIDLKAVRRDRDQLWAEALHWEAKEASLVLPEDLWAHAAKEQNSRMYQDPWTDLLAEAKGTPMSGEERIFTKELLALLEIPASQQQHFQSTRLAGCMQSLGWTGPKRLRVNSKSLMGYCRPLVTDGDNNDTTF